MDAVAKSAVAVGLAAAFDLDSVQGHVAQLNEEVMKLTDEEEKRKWIVTPRVEQFVGVTMLAVKAGRELSKLYRQLRG